MYDPTLLKLYNFLCQAYGPKYVVILIYNFLIKFGYYCNYYMIIWRKKFELSLEDSWNFYLSLEHGLEWNMWA
jgi:hypothetical protein